MKICTRCVLPETFPAIRFDDAGVCNFCLRFKSETEGEARKNTVRRKFEELAKQVRRMAGFHCTVACSGGKDSTYTLWLLREHYDLRVLAVTFDNGFMSPQAFVNVRRAVEAVNADQLLIKPRFDLMQQIFARVSAGDSPYPMKALERASSICNACMAMVKNVTLRVTVERGIPLLAYGWSPGQAPLSAALFQMNPALLTQMHETRSGPLRRIAGDAVEPYLFSESHLRTLVTLPHSVNPLAFHAYGKERVLDQVKKLGWEAPLDTDGNSSNCLLNTYANRLHIEKYGFHPYAFEVARLVRSGVTSREEGLADLADLGSPEVLTALENRLGVRKDA